jgi:hypothetical protein
VLKWNERSAAGNLGGWPRLENQLISATDPESGICTLYPEPFTRLIAYLLRKSGPGGPNGRVRKVCFPALRRIGIELVPGWQAPVSTGRTGSTHTEELRDGIAH